MRRPQVSEGVRDVGTAFGTLFGGAGLALAITGVVAAALVCGGEGTVVTQVDATGVPNTQPGTPTLEAARTDGHVIECPDTHNRRTLPPGGTLFTDLCDQGNGHSGGIWGCAYEVFPLGHPEQASSMDYNAMAAGEYCVPKPDVTEP